MMPGRQRLRTELFAALPLLLTTTIEGKSVVAFSPEVKNPVYVRYAWPNAPVANLANSSGLSASTFTSEKRLSAITSLPTAH